MNNTLNDIESCFIYTRDNCRFCVLAKELLKENKINFNEIKLNDINTKYQLYNILSKKFKREIKTLPQIIINSNVLVGGYTELYNLLQKKDTKECSK
jgi:glutaredoxin 3